MIGFVEPVNDTVVIGHLNNIVALMSMMTPYFHLNSFTVITNGESRPWMFEFQKMTSEKGIKMNFDSTYRTYKPEVNEEIGYVLLTDDVSFNFTKIIETRPKLIVAIFFTNDNNFDIPELTYDAVISYRTSFFVVEFSDIPKNSLITESSSLTVLGKCVRIYKPSEEVPVKTFPTLYYGGTNGSDLRWHWEAPGLTWTSYIENTKNLSGITVKLGMVYHKPKNITIKKFKSTGNSFFWSVLADVLRFKIEYHVEILKKYDENVLKITYYAILKSKTVDGLGELPAITAERGQFLEYIPIGLDSKYHLIVKSPEFVHSWQSVLKPFTEEAWLGLILNILLIAIIFWIITLVSSVSSKGFFECFLIIFGFLCGQSSQKIPRLCSGRVVCYTGLVLSVLVFQYYTSNLYSILSTKQVHLPFTSIEDFLSKGTQKLYMHPNTAIYDIIEDAKEGLLKEIWERGLKINPNHKLEPQSRRPKLHKICQGKGAIIGMLFQTLEMKELQCSMVPVGPGFFPMNVVIVLRDYYPFKPQFRDALLRCLEVGLSHKFRDKYLNAENQKIPDPHVTNQPVGLEQVALLFVIYGGFIVISCIILCIEIFHSSRKSKSRKRIKTKKRIRLFLATSNAHFLGHYQRNRMKNNDKIVTTYLCNDKII